MIDQQTLKAKFDYRSDGCLVLINDAETDIWKRRAVGFMSFSKDRPDKIYRATKIKGRQYAVHKLIWLWHHGEYPEQIDHINRNGLDNRIENLRLATASQNMMNRKRFKNNSSGVTGVSWHKKSERWFVYVDANKKRKNVGYFDDLELAELVAIEARDLYHGKFARLA